MSYSDVMAMPTYERRFFIRIFTDQIEKEKERIEEAKKNTTTNGKGRRVTKISGKESVAKYSGKI